MQGATYLFKSALHLQSTQWRVNADGREETEYQVMIMEEMIACGARVFLGLGWAGSLQETATVGTMPTDFHTHQEESPLCS